MFLQYNGNKHAGLRSSRMKSRERSASPRPSGTMNQAGRTSSVRYEGVRMESTSSFVRYEESSRQNFVCLLRSRAIGMLVLVRLVRGIKSAGLRPYGTKSHEGRACPCLTSRRNQSGGTSSIRYEVVQKESLSSFVRYEESRRWDFVH